jgi:ankyrin repeat protein
MEGRPSPNLELADLLLSSFPSSDDGRKSILINSGNKVIGKEGTTLAEACKKVDLETIKYLLANGANVNARGRQGLTPLMFASRSCNVDVVSHLITVDGIDLNAKNDQGKNALEVGEGNGERGEGVVAVLKTVIS